MPKAVSQNINVVALRPAPSLADLADELGALQLALKPMVAREKQLKALLKEANKPSISGARFVVEISYRAGPDRLDLAKAVADYGREWLVDQGYLIHGGMQEVLTSRPLPVATAPAVAAE